MDEITIGDTMTPIVLTIADADGVTRDISGWTVRLFLEGQSSGDRPYAPAASNATASACSITSASDQLTRATGSFITDGFVAGMLLFGDATGIADGVEVESVDDATHITMTQPATATVSGTLGVTGWNGISCSITSGSTGEATAAGVGALLNIGALASDVYVGKARCLDGTSGEVGWTNNARGYVTFKAVLPGSGA